jgi:hypothetical protein
MGVIYLVTIVQGGWSLSCVLPAFPDIGNGPFLLITFNVPLPHLGPEKTFTKQTQPSQGQ